LYVVVRTKSADRQKLIAIVIIDQRNMEKTTATETRGNIGRRKRILQVENQNGEDMVKTETELRVKGVRGVNETETTDAMTHEITTANHIAARKYAAQLCSLLFQL